MPFSTITHREKNQILGALPFDDWLFIESHLEWMEMRAGSVLFASGKPMRYVYFPTTSVVSLVTTLHDGATVEVAAVGNEGMVGVDSFMGSGQVHDSGSSESSLSAQCTAIVLHGGHGYRMSAQSISHQAKRSMQVMHHLLNYTRTLFLQVAQTSGCNRHHSLDQQLARWLLVHLDRQDIHEIVITQERMASMLGVRREGVTGAARRLQDAGVIRSVRGQVSVIDRVGLEAHSCECPAVIRHAYERLKNDAVLQEEPPPHNVRRRATIGQLTDFELNR